jgi:two-component system cell cycle response regulator
MNIPAVTQQVKSTRPRSRTSQDACLVRIYPRGSSIGTRYLLNGVELILGRGEDCDITVHDCSVSRRHTRFELGIGGYLATDLGSTNGTFVNDKPADRTLLTDGDYLRTGNCLFRFLEGGNVEADYHEELYRLAIIDALTGLHNKRHLLDYLEREVTRSTRLKRPLSVILLDIDHFKGINDTLGHLAGDLTLRELATRLRSEICGDEMLARYGGEEFAAVLTETDLGEAIRIAERFREAASSQPFTFEDHRFHVTISLGVFSMRGGESFDPQELIRQADTLLYRAKREGRDRVIAASQSVEDEASLVTSVLDNEAASGPEGAASVLRLSNGRDASHASREPA